MGMRAMANGEWRYDADMRVLRYVEDGDPLLVAHCEGNQSLGPRVPHIQVLRACGGDVMARAVTAFKELHMALCCVGGEHELDVKDVTRVNPTSEGGRLN